MDRRKLLLGVAGASAALLGADKARLAATGPTDRTRAITGELLIAGFSGSNAQAPSAQALAEQIRSGAVGGVVFVKDNVGDRDDVLGLVRLFSAGAPRKVIVAIDHEGGAVQRLIEAHGCTRLPPARQVASDHTVAEGRPRWPVSSRFRLFTTLSGASAKREARAFSHSFERT